MDQNNRERINSGLDYWNGGIVDWNVFALDFIIYHIVSTLQIFLHLSSIRIPRFWGLLIVTVVDM